MKIIREEIDNKELLAHQQEIPETDPKAHEEQNSAFAAASRSRSKFAKIKADNVKVQLEPKHDENPKNPKMAQGAKKMYLDESLFEDLYTAQELFDDETKRAIAKDELGMEVNKAALSDGSRKAFARHKLGLDKKLVDIDPEKSLSDQARKELAKQKLGMISRDEMSDEAKKAYATRELGLNKNKFMGKKLSDVESLTEAKPETTMDKIRKIVDLEEAVTEELTDSSHIEHGSEVDNIPTFDTKIKDWYSVKFPDDYQLDNIDPDITFKQLLDAMEAGKDIYVVASVDGQGFDSMIRENIFDAMDRYMDVKYDYLYDLWLNSDDEK